MAELAVISQDFCSLSELQTQGNRPINFKSVSPLVIAQYTLGPATADMQSLSYSYGFLRKISLDETRVGNLKITRTSSFIDGSNPVVVPSAHLDMDGNRVINLGDADMGGPSPNSQGTPHHGVNLRVGDQRYLRKESWSTDQNRTMMGDLIFNSNLAIKTNIANGVLSITSSSSPASNNAKIVLNSENGTVDITANSMASVNGNLTVGGTSTLENSINFVTGGLYSQERRIKDLRRLNGVSEYIGSTYDNDPITIGDVKAYVIVRGMVIMWAGPEEDNFDETGLGINILEGWALCNGQTHTFNDVVSITPDLRDRFIIGANSHTDSRWQTGITGEFRQTGGSKDAIIVQHNHTISSNSGQHGHSITDPGHVHSHTRLAGGGVSGTGRKNGISGRTTDVTSRAVTNISVNVGGGHSHVISSEGVSGINRNLPPFYALAYIIKL